MSSIKLVIFVSAFILVLVFKLQHKSWNFTHIEHITNFAQGPESAYRQPHALLLLGSDVKDVRTGLNCFDLAQMRQLPHSLWKLTPFMPYSYAWLNNPAYSEELWLDIEELLSIRYQF